MIVRGVDVARPDLGVSGTLTERALGVWPETVQKCLAGLGLPDSFGGIAPAEIFQQGANVAPTLAYINSVDPETLTIRTPVRIDQGAADGTVLPMFTDGLVVALKKRKVPLEFRSYPGVDHGSIPAKAAKVVNPWIKKQLATKKRAATGKGRGR
jgi:hypothetical protein